jgi:hypothetical protein
VTVAATTKRVRSSSDSSTLRSRADQAAIGHGEPGRSPVCRMIRLVQPIALRLRVGLYQVESCMHVWINCHSIAFGATYWLMIEKPCTLSTNGSTLCTYNANFFRARKKLFGGKSYRERARESRVSLLFLVLLFCPRGSASCSGKDKVWYNSHYSTTRSSPYYSLATSLLPVCVFSGC